MTLYCKAAEDGTSVGDCPFAHFNRLVLEEKGLEYDLKPSTEDTKPTWLVEYYEGKMPALRHRKECYVESSVIGSYLEFFFPQPSLTPTNKDLETNAESAVDGLFPAIAKFLKDTDDTDETLSNLKSKLQAVEDHLASLEEGSFLAGNEFTLVDCRIVPQLYHLSVGITEFKNNSPSLQEEYPLLYNYLQRCQDRPSFQATQYPPSTIIWGWNNARSN
jgi:glutathione S-transferase